MAVIRHTESAAHLREAIVLDLGDLARQGEALKRQAQKKAEQILAEAQRTADALVAEAAEKGRKAGYTEGFDQGLAEGRAQGDQRAYEEEAARREALEASWKQALEEFITQRSGLLAETAQDVLRLAISIAQRITFRTLELDPSVVEDQVAEALRLMARRSGLRIVVNPADAAAVERILPVLGARLRGCEDAELVHDESVTRGGCMILGSRGEVDARIDVQLARVVDTLLPPPQNPSEPRHANAPTPDLGGGDATA